MSPLNPLYAVTIITIAYITGYLFNLNIKKNDPDNRFNTIDGLRGFLALGVFIHHSTIWHQYIKTGKWSLPDSNLYIHLGETSVTLFFMITSFLFVTKLIDTKETEFNWKQFFISRFFRLAPVYIFSILIITFLVMQISDWNLNVTIYAFVNSIIEWLTFTIIDRPYINNYEFTDKINAGVTWSLAYEWLFYFSLPIIYLLMFYKKTKVKFKNNSPIIIDLNLENVKNKINTFWSFFNFRKPVHHNNFYRYIFSIEYIIHIPI